MLAKHLKTIEKVIGILLIANGALSFILIIGFLMIGEVISSFAPTLISDFNSFSEALLNAPMLFVGAILTIVAGIQFLRFEKHGYLLALIATAYSGISGIIEIVEGNVTGTSYGVDIDFTDFFVLASIMFGLLLAKPFREKYQANNTTWLIAGSATFILILGDIISAIF